MKDLLTIPSAILTEMRPTLWVRGMSGGAMARRFGNLTPGGGGNLEGRFLPFAQTFAVDVVIYDYIG